jgi:hypothetical protein
LVILAVAKLNRPSFTPLDFRLRSTSSMRSWLLMLSPEKEGGCW